jgi:hypothetical protein
MITSQRQQPGQYYLHNLDTRHQPEHKAPLNLGFAAYVATKGGVVVGLESAGLVVIRIQRWPYHRGVTRGHQLPAFGNGAADRRGNA